MRSIQALYPKFLPLMKGEMKEGVGRFSKYSNHPQTPSFIRRGSLWSSCFLLTAFIFVCSICWADMTIYFKDGSSLNVLKIVFRQNLADLYLPDGSMQTYAVDKIDLKSSGIPRAEGTYGQTHLSPSVRKKPGAGKPLIGDPKLRQLQLKEEWERAEKFAVALKNVGPIRQGDIVRISNQTASGSDSGYFGTFEEIKDDAYIVIYINPNGTLGKKLFDAVTFQSNFKMNEKSVEPPEPIIVPPKKADTQTSLSEKSQKESKPEPVSVPETVDRTPKEITEPAGEKPGVVSVQEGDQSFPVMPVTIVAGSIAIVGGALFVYSRKRKKPFLNVSKFKQFEEELRDFELEIWLKHGRTMDQLMEICVKKFYQDQPNPLAVAMKMLKGGDRTTIVHSISRQSGLSFENAEEVYLEMLQRMEWIRETIKSVSARTGRSPLEQPTSSSVKTIPQTPMTQPASQATQVPKAPSKVEISDPEISSPPQVMIPATSQPSRPAQPSGTGLPTYLKNVLKHLGDLSD